MHREGTAMDEQNITKWVKAGYPYLKEGAGLASWVLPQRSLQLVADELQDSGVLRMSRPLKLAEGIEAVYDRIPDPSVFTAEAWRQAVSQWPPLAHVKPVVEAYVEIADRVAAQLERLKHRLDPAVIRHSLVVLLMAPLVPQGRQVMEEIADILGGKADQPAQLIRDYAGAVIEADIATLERIDRCIVRYEAWTSMASGLEQGLATMKSRLKLIGVTPPASSELAGVLAQMVEEEQRDEFGRDYPER